MSTTRTDEVSAPRPLGPPRTPTTSTPPPRRPRPRVAQHATAAAHEAAFRSAGGDTPSYRNRRRGDPTPNYTQRHLDRAALNPPLQPFQDFNRTDARRFEDPSAGPPPDARLRARSADDLLFYDELQARSAAQRSASAEPPDADPPTALPAGPPATPTTVTVTPGHVDQRHPVTQADPTRAPDGPDFALLDHALDRPSRAWSHDPTLFEWDAQRTEAAVLLASGATVPSVASATGLTRDNLGQLLAFAPFRDRVRQLAAELAERVLQEGIAVKVHRVREKAHRHELLQRLLRERAERLTQQFPDARDVPGATTGVVVRRERVIGSGLSAREVVEWELDKDLLGALSALEAEVAKELGQLTERQELTVVPKAYVGVDLDRV